MNAPQRAGAAPATGEADPDVTGAVSRLNTSQREQLERVMGAGLVGRGSVFVLSLAPVRDETGAKWDFRKEQVWERVERTLTANLPIEDVCLRVDDISMMVAVNSCSAYEGQARCVTLLRQIMAHFLGREGDDDIRISRVTSIDGDHLIGEPIDIRAAPDPRYRASAVEAGVGAGHLPPDKWTPPLAGRTYAAPFTSIRGEAVEMELRVTPVWCLRRGAISSYAIRRRFPNANRPINDYDQEAADKQTAIRMVELLKEYAAFGGLFALHVPIFFATASSRRSRVNMLGRSAPVLPLMRQVAIIEIEGIDDGVPFSRMKEAVAMLSPFVRAVMAGVNEGQRLNTQIRDCGFAGVAVQAGPGPVMRPELKYLLAQARRVTPNVVVHDADLSPEVEARLPGLGVSHLSGKARDPVG